MTPARSMAKGTETQNAFNNIITQMFVSHFVFHIIEKTSSGWVKFQYFVKWKNGKPLKIKETQFSKTSFEA